MSQAISRGGEQARLHLQLALLRPSLSSPVETQQSMRSYVSVNTQMMATIGGTTMAQAAKGAQVKARLNFGQFW